MSNYKNRSKVLIIDGSQEQTEFMVLFVLFDAKEFAENPRSASIVSAHRSIPDARRIQQKASQETVLVRLYTVGNMHPLPEPE